MTLKFKLRCAWENLTTNRRIRFTWGGSGNNLVIHLRFVPGRSAVYIPIFYGVESCYEAQRITQRANAALKQWAPRLLHEDAELPGVGFQYPKPEKEEANSNG